MKQCSTCQKTKPLSEFGKHRGREDGLQAFCRECSKAYRKRRKESGAEAAWQRKNIHRIWASNTRSGHRKYEVQVTLDELTEVAKRTTNCYLCGVELHWQPVGGPKGLPNSPTWDRINNETVMTLDNTAIACLRCNSMKGKWKYGEFIEICRTIVRISEER